MASSLLFRIQSVFDNTGFREAAGSFASTLGWIGKLTAGMGKFLFSAKTIGTVLGVMTAIDIAKGIGATVKYLWQAAPAAAAAEVTFNRLQMSLSAIGKGSKDNVELVTEFAKQASLKSRYSAEEIESAFTSAVRKTGSMRLALKEVSVAQNMAAATGMDLGTAVAYLNRAMTGQTRMLGQLTNLRQADIQLAVKQGTLLDLVSSKFAGGAAKDLETYSAKHAMLTNILRVNQQELGNLLLPLKKTGVEFQIAGARVESYLIGLLTAPMTLKGFWNALIGTTDAAKKLKEMMLPGKEFSFNFGKEFEIQAKQLESGASKISKAVELKNMAIGTSYEQQKQLAADVKAAEDALSFAVHSGTEDLTKEQLDSIKKFKWASDELDRVVKESAGQASEAFATRDAVTEAARKADEALAFAIKYGTAQLSEAQKDSIKKFQYANQEYEGIQREEITNKKALLNERFELDREAAAKESEMTGTDRYGKQLAQEQEILNNAKKLNLTKQQTIDLLTRSFNVTTAEAQKMVESGSALLPVIGDLDKMLATGKARGGLKDDSLINKAQIITNEAVTAIKAQIDPLWKFAINFNMNPEQIKMAVATAVAEALPGLLNSAIRNQAVTKNKEQKAAVPLV